MRFWDFDLERQFETAACCGMMERPAVAGCAASIEGFLGLATSRILSRHLASFSPTHIAISVSQPAAPRFTLAPASAREQDRGRKPRFPQKLHEVRVDRRVASGAMRDENSYSFMQIAVTFASQRYQLSAEIMSRMFSNTYEQASVTRAQS